MEPGVSEGRRQPSNTPGSTGSSLIKLPSILQRMSKQRRNSSRTYRGQREAGKSSCSDGPFEQIIS